MESAYFLAFLCLAYTAKNCVVLTHDDYICAENPDCFTLLIKQQEKLSDTISKQLALQQRQLDIQEQQLKAFVKLSEDVNSSSSVFRQVTSSFISNVVYIIIFGAIVSAIPWVFGKLSGLKKKFKEDRVDRALADSIMNSVRAQVYGSGLCQSERSTVPVSPDLHSVEMHGMASECEVGVSGVTLRSQTLSV